jgi:hypothetical protein
MLQENREGVFFKDNIIVVTGVLNEKHRMEGGIPTHGLVTLQVKYTPIHYHRRDANNLL